MRAFASILTLLELVTTVASNSSSGSVSSSSIATPSASSASHEASSSSNVYPSSSISATPNYSNSGSSSSAGNIPTSSSGSLVAATVSVQPRGGHLVGEFTIGAGTAELIIDTSANNLYANNYTSSENGESLNLTFTSNSTMWKGPQCIFTNMNISLYTDDVGAGDVMIQNQVFGWIQSNTNASSDSSSTRLPQDGIFGLAPNNWTFTNETGGKEPSFYQNLYNRTLDKQGWSLALDSNGYGSLTLGDWDLNDMTAIPVTVPANLTQTKWWFPANLGTANTTFNGIAYLATWSENVSSSTSFKQGAARASS